VQQAQELYGARNSKQSGSRSKSGFKEGIGKGLGFYGIQMLGEGVKHLFEHIRYEIEWAEVMQAFGA
jgi:hypothetical protein